MRLLKVNNLVRQDQAHRHRRISGQKVMHNRGHMKLAKHDRRGHAQVPPGLPILAARRAFGFREGVEDAPRCGYKNLAGFRQDQSSAVAYKKPHPESGF